MLITVTCPICGRRSQIDAKHRGSRLRCPYADCRKPFKVLDDGEPLAIADMVAGDEPVAPPRPSEPRASRQEEPRQQEAKVADWQATPPPVRDWRTDAPPVRQPGFEGQETPDPWSTSGVAVAEPTDSVVSAEADGAVEDYQSYALPRRSGARRVLWSFLLLALTGSGIAGYFVWQSARWTENALAERADQEYAEGRYLHAGHSYQELLEKYPTSENAPRFQFMARLCSIRGLVQSAQADVPYAQALLAELVKEHRQKPHFKEKQKDIEGTLLTVTDLAAKEAERQGDRRHLKAGQKALALSLELSGAAESSVRPTELRTKLTRAEEAVIVAEARRDLLAEFARLTREAKPGGVEEAQQRYEAATEAHPRLTADAELRGRLDSFRSVERSWIKFVPASQSPSPSPHEVTEGPGLLIAPLIQAPKEAPLNDTSVVFALARGILYALSPNGDQVRWARRVGIDANTLPLRLPPGLDHPELAVIFSPETNSLLGLDLLTGRTHWTFAVGAAAPAGPMRIGRYLYLPTVDGKLHKLGEDGVPLGHFELGQPVTMPGAIDPATQRLCLPAEHKRIYVLDLAREECAGILYTGHAPGALRAGPLVAEGALILAEAHTLQSMKIRVFALQDSQADIQPLAEYDVPGWSWFAPHFNENERTLAYLTDRGYLALFALDGRAKERLVRLAEPLPIAEAVGPSAQTPVLGRGQIVREYLTEWWLLWDNRLWRQRFDLFRQQLAPVASSRPPLGTPLHETQPAVPDGHVLSVTQAPGQPRCLATSLDPGSLSIQWQRQLGLVCSHDPVILKEHVLAADRAGAVFQLDLQTLPKESPGEWWINGGKWLANGRDEISSTQVLAAADQSFAVLISLLRSGDQISLRRFEPGAGLSPEKSYPLPSPPAGTPTLSGQNLILPCQDGKLYELTLEGGATPVPLTWRNATAGVRAFGHALCIDENQLFVSDGLRKVQCWRRDASGDRSWRKTAEDPEPLANRIATSLLAVTTANGEKYVCAGDEAGTIYLISGKRLRIEREWPLKGRITRGPFALGEWFGVIIDGRRLVWLDPAAKQPRGEYEAGMEGTRGDPRRVGDFLLVTENRGAFTWIDAETGQVRARQTLQTSVAPVTAAVPVSKDQALAPLSDGTMLFLTGPGP